MLQISSVRFDQIPYLPNTIPPISSYSILGMGTTVLQAWFSVSWELGARAALQ
jgi:hypothetical protein